MVDGIKDVVTPDVKVEAKKEEVVSVPEPQIDPAIFDSIRMELDTIKGESKQNKEVINKLKNVLNDNKEDEFNEEKFVEQFVKSPKKTLDEYLSKRTAPEREELEKLKKEIKESRIVDEDSRQLDAIKSNDSDFDVVMANIGRVIDQKDFADLHKSLENNPLRNEIIYNTLKARVMKLDDVKKMTQENAAKTAKEEINRTARTLQPTGGSIDTMTPQDERRDRIAKAKDKFDVDSVLDEIFDGDYTTLFKRRVNAD